MISKHLQTTALLCALCVLCGESARGQTTTRVSVDSNGNESVDFCLPIGCLLDSADPDISDDGRFVVWRAYATKLVPDDTNGMADIFLHDRDDATTIRVSVDSAGNQSNNHSFGARISRDGRWILLHSWADNLAPNDLNGVMDVFLHDRITGATERVSLPDPSMGGPGSEIIGQASQNASISDDGRYVAFQSSASNVVPGITNGIRDIFVRDRLLGTTVRVSVASDGTEANYHEPIPGDSGSWFPEISGDGRYVAFESTSTNLVPGDTNGMWDVFLHDRQTHSTTRVSVSSSGAQGDGHSRHPRISQDGSYITFSSAASNLVPGDTNGHWDVFVHNVPTGTTERVSVATNGDQGNNASALSRISSDGRFVVFSSGATNFDALPFTGPVQVFLHDRLTGTTERVSLNANNGPANGEARRAAVSADGDDIAFDSLASNLVAGDTNGAVDIFVRTRRLVPDTTPCPADLTGSGTVGVPDLLQLLSCWGAIIPGAGCESADLTASGSVGVPDLLQLLAVWGPCP